MAAACADCRICTDSCAFLKTNGSPGQMARQYQIRPGPVEELAFDCSLCGLCQAVCPRGLDAAGMFLALRRRAVLETPHLLAPYRRILTYEARGVSRLFSFYGLPRECDTVFFPGCTLSGTRPDQTLMAYQALQAVIPGIGIVLNCCTKPSHDLGRQSHFETAFYELTDWLTRRGIRNILLACPSCHAVFSRYARAFSVRTIYEVLADAAQHRPHQLSRLRFTLHDPCQTRFATQVQASVRTLLASRGIRFTLPAHSGDKTVCCGQGGAACFRRPDLAATWRQAMGRTSRSETFLTYCAGCATALSGGGRAAHVLDLLFDSGFARRGRAKVSRPPLTYLNRLRLKKRLKRMAFHRFRERPAG